jgi:hypothetical protein
MTVQPGIPEEKSGIAPLDSRGQHCDPTEQADNGRSDRALPRPIKVCPHRRFHRTGGPAIPAQQPERTFATM